MKEKKSLMNTMFEKYKKDFNTYEKVFKYLNFLPQYKYVAKPTYLAFGGKNNPLASVPAAFAATDYLCHQVLPGCAIVLFSKGKIRPQNIASIFKPNYIRTGLWTSLSIPVAINKYNRIKP